MSHEAIAREARAHWLDALRDHGLSRYVDALSPLVRATIRVEPRSATAEDQRIGASRLGGAPDLPEALPWPADEQGPLPFIAQFDLAVLAPLDLGHQLPPHGLLSFFGGWGDGGARGSVLHLQGVALAPRIAPAGVDTAAAQGVELALGVELPPHTSRFVAIDAATSAHHAFDPHTGESAPLPRPVVPLPVAEHVRYAEVYALAQRERAGGSHGLLGYDRAMEGALRPDEVLLLRLDADGTIEHPFEEASVLYFLIDGAALERGEFGVARPWYGATL